MATDTSAISTTERQREDYDEALRLVERCHALGRAIQHESDDGDEHSPLYSVLDDQLCAIDKIFEINRHWGGYGPPKESGAAPDDDDDTEQPRAQTFSEYAERELSDIKKVLVEIDHLAHDGQDSNDPVMTLAVIERLAADAQSVMYGEFWDKLTAGLKRADEARS